MEKVHLDECQVPVIQRDSWIIPIHGSLHILVDPVTRGCGGKSTNRAKNPRVGWVNRAWKEGTGGY